MALSKDAEELLQALYCMEEEGKRPLPVSEVMARARVSKDAAVQEVIHVGLADEHKGALTLSKEGRDVAAGIVRRHRLAERLLSDVLRVSDEARESAACEFEHTLADEVTESICTLLGHPRACPHGKPIPPGACCSEKRRSLDPVVQRLSELKAGDTGTVAYVHSASAARLDRLASFGLVPGSAISMHQCWPSFVIALGETQLAVDQETADDIFVRRSVAPRAAQERRGPS